MSELPITGVDMAVIGVLLISGIIAFARGFVRELLSIAAFIAAALATLWAFRPTQEVVSSMVQPEWLSGVIVAVGVFLIVYVAVTLVTHSVTKLIHRNDRVGFFDRTLGFVFGLARGLVLAALALIIYNAAIPSEQWPDWLTRSQTYPLVNKTAQALQELAPESARIAAKAIPPVDG